MTAGFTPVKRYPMRVFKEGTSVTVVFSAQEVALWNRRWSSSSLRGPQSFTFDRKGVLVDCFGEGDGPEAVSMVEDAKRLAFGRHTK
jgi:hypothetical protein